MAQITGSKGNKGRDANELAKRMQMQREEKISSHRRFIEKRPILVEGIESEQIFGRDERGRKVDLKAKNNGGMVQLGFKREIVGQMGTGFKEGDPIPRKIVYVETDIYNAVRSLKHLRESQIKEREQNERLAKEIDRIHATLYTQNASMKNEDLLHLSSVLDSVAKSVLKKTSGYKLLAKWKLDAVPELLRKAAKEETPFKRTNLISNACAKLVAFKERHNRWRERQILKIGRYNSPREDGLRYMRDKQLRALLRELSGELLSPKSIEKGSELIMGWEVIKKLRSAQVKLSQNKPQESLQLIEDASKFINNESVRAELGAPFLLIEQSLKERKNGWRKEARSMLENIARKFGQKNPRYIIIELKKTNDVYMDPILLHMEQGNAFVRESFSEKRDWMKKKLLKQAAAQYRQAATKLIPK